MKRDDRYGIPKGQYRIRRYTNGLGGERWRVSGLCHPPGIDGPDSEYWAELGWYRSRRRAEKRVAVLQGSLRKMRLRNWVPEIGDTE